MRGNLLGGPQYAKNPESKELSMTKELTMQILVLTHSRIRQKRRAHLGVGIGNDRGLRLLEFAKILSMMLANTG